MILRWPGKVPAGKVENGIMSGLDWFPTLVAAAGNPNIVDELLKGKQLGDRTYKVHLDGYNQTGPDHRQGSVEAPRDLLLHREHALRRCGSTTSSTGSPISRKAGWAARVKVDWPILTNLRLDPFERTGMPSGANGSLAYYNWFAVRVLALRVRAAGGGEGRANRDRVPADAEGRELQPRGRQSSDREGPSRARPVGFPRRSAPRRAVRHDGEQRGELVPYALSDARDRRSRCR